MTLPLPDLDDRTFADLVDEARTLIRTYEPEWTNYNPSDPGVTLIELFAWLAEMLIYRANQVPDRHRIAFLRLLNGQPEWEPSPDTTIDDEIAVTLTAVRRRFRAVTVADHEALALEASPDVARALCIARRDLNAPDEAGRAMLRPGYVSVIVVPVPAVAAVEADAAALRETVRAYLAPRRLLTTQHVVAEPVRSPVSCLVLVAPRADVVAADAAVSVTIALRRFLDPLEGGPDGGGWPFGRDVYASDLYRVLEALPDVDYVPDIELSSACPGDDPRCAPAPQLWNAQGDQIGLQLAPHALPRVADDAIRLASGTFVTVRVVVTIKAAADDRPEAMRSTKARLRAIFHPLLSTRDGTSAWSTTVASVRTSLGTPAGVAEVVEVALSSDPAHLAVNEQNELVLALREHELVDLQPEVVVSA
jgi:hypothetical protein